MMGFWDKALGGPTPRPRPAASPWQRGAYTRQIPQSQPQPPPESQLSPGLPPGFEGLAIQPTQNRADQEAGYLAATNGYIKKPPDWVKNQPTDHCPNCGGVNFALHGESEGSYGRERKDPRKDAVHPTYIYGHCFDCGYRYNGPALSAGQEGNSHLPASGAVQTTRQPHGLRNFFEIKEHRR